MLGRTAFRRPIRWLLANFCHWHHRLAYSLADLPNCACAGVINACDAVNLQPSRTAKSQMGYTDDHLTAIWGTHLASQGDVRR